MEMNGFKIGSIRGIPIRIHFTFLLILPLLAFAFSRAFREAARVAEVPANELGSPLLWGLGLALALFLSVLLHELAHSLYALRKGGQVRDITLMMVGGVSQISEMPREPRHEAIMAFAGPLTSIVLGVVLFGVHALIADTPSFQLRFATFYLGGLNLFLGFFNLLPAFPMDGGRILRALLAMKLDYSRATAIAVAVGQGLAWLLGLWALMTGSYTLVLIAVFIWLGAGSEGKQQDVKSVLREIKVGQAMTRQPFVLSTNDSLDRAVELTLSTTQVDYPVVHFRDHTLVGMLGEADLIKGLRAQGGSGLVRQYARAQVPTATPDEPLYVVQQRMAENRLRAIPVVDATGQILGLLTATDANEAYRLLSTGLKLAPSMQ
jgi:Zn-dependent protease/predicted transcriptional regulator